MITAKNTIDALDRALQQEPWLKMRRLLPSGELKLLGVKMRISPASGSEEIVDGALVGQQRYAGVMSPSGLTKEIPWGSLPWGEFPWNGFIMDVPKRGDTILTNHVHLGVDVATPVILYGEIVRYNVVMTGAQVG